MDFEWINPIIRCLLFVFFCRNSIRLSNKQGNEWKMNRRIVFFSRCRFRWIKRTTTSRRRGWASPWQRRATRPLPTPPTGGRRRRRRRSCSSTSARRCRACSAPRRCRRTGAVPTTPTRLRPSPRPGETPDSVALSAHSVFPSLKANIFDSKREISSAEKKEMKKFQNRNFTEQFRWKWIT